MEQMPPIRTAPMPPTTIQVLPEVVMQKDRMGMSVDQLKWIEKLVCVCVCIVVVVYTVLMK
jgi:hypothetical protein